MNNLGWYQWFTTNAKKVGGPLSLMGLIAVGGYAIIRTVEAGEKKIIKVVKVRHKRALNDELPICNVTADGSIEKERTDGLSPFGIHCTGCPPLGI